MKRTRGWHCIVLLHLVAVSSEKPPVIEWLQSKEGGYFSDKVAFENGGMFARKQIEKGEVIMTIPPDALLGPSEGDDEDDLDECATARRLVFEYATLGETTSEFWPYVQYVFESFPHTTVPLGWSEEGKQLVRDIVGPSLYPQRFGYGSYAEACKYDLEDSEDEEEEDVDEEESKELLEAAWRIVISRGWHHVMVPVYDMVNHRNGDWHNIDRDESNNANLEVDGDFRIVALKDISVGSQLHNSYNQCHDVTCFGIEKSYITPNIFGDYGFVEQFPRRFAFDTGHDEDDELGMVFEIDIKDGETKVLWLTEGSPNQGQIGWMEEQWKRLTDPTFAQNVAERAQNLNKPSERSSSMEYYQALVGALEQALQSARRHGAEGATDEF